MSKGSFKETIVERARRDKKFRRGMLMRGIALIIAGDKDDMQAGKGPTRAYLNVIASDPKFVLQALEEI